MRNVALFFCTQSIDKYSMCNYNKYVDTFPFNIDGGLLRQAQHNTSRVLLGAQTRIFIYHNIDICYHILYNKYIPSIYVAFISISSYGRVFLVILAYFLCKILAQILFKNKKRTTRQCGPIYRCINPPGHIYTYIIMSHMQIVNIFL